MGSNPTGPSSRRLATGGYAARVRLERFETIEGFLGAARDFLADREAEHNLLFGISHTLLTAPGVYPKPPYLAVVSDGIEVVAAAMQTPPWNLVLSETDRPAAADLFVEDRVSDPPPGVLGPTALAERFAAGLAQRTGTPVRLRRRERIFELDTLVMPRRVMGGMRAAGRADRAVLVDWLTEFVDEALDGESPTDVEAIVDRWIEGSGRTMYLWVDNGLPVSMTGVGSPTPNGVRVGPVYTPRDLRGRGYASNLVARACQAAFGAGRRSVFLFTDLGNPTSNHIYQAIGFRPVTDVDDWAIG